MRDNPFLDGFAFVIGATNNHAVLGAWHYLFTAFTTLLILSGLAIAITRWRDEPAQRTFYHLTLFTGRALIGAMWLEGSLWKLPLPSGGGLPYWLGLMGENAAFPIYADVINGLLIPHASLVSSIIWLAETTLAVSLILGLAVRPISLLGVAMSLNLWIGLYRFQPEWPWIYIFIAILHAFFIATRAGRSLGLDGIIAGSATKNNVIRRWII